MRIPLAVFLLVALAGCGCGSGNGPAAGTDNTDADAGNTTNAADSDTTLTIAQYRSLGIPDPDRSWTPDEYQRVVSALGKLAAEHPDQLPRISSRRSGPVFARMVANENLTAFDEGLPLETRQNQSMLVRDQVLKLSTMWHAAIQGRLMAGESVAGLTMEAAEIDGFLLEVWLRITDVEVAIVHSATDGMTRGEVTQKLNAISRSLTRYVTTLIGRFNEFGRVTSGDANYDAFVASMFRLADHLEEKMPRVAIRLMPGARDEVKAIIQEQLTRVFDNQLGARLRRVAALIQ